jgi:putative endonuclease
MVAILPRIGLALVQWKARHGLQPDDPSLFDEKKLEALGIGAQGERYAYWYLRRQGYIFIARNCAPARRKGEIDLVGYDGETLAFVEVRTRAAIKGKPALPELSITKDKHEVLVRTAHYFLREWHIKECPVRFDVAAIDHVPGAPPIVRLHKDALSPDIRRGSRSRI